jgi:hypothetical protein
MNKQIEKEVALAYSDCHGDKPFEETEKTRNLSFRASAPVSRDEAVRIMEKYVPGYNAFSPSLLEHLPKDSQVTIAREGSVCVYVKSKTKLSLVEGTKLLADEVDDVEGMTRLWWD